MPSARLIATLCVPLAGVSLLVGLSRVWQAEGGDIAVASGGQATEQNATPEPPAAPAAVPSGAPAGVVPSPSLGTQGDAVFAAVGVVQRFCDLVDRGLWVRAGELLAGPWVWPSGELRAFVHLRFRSAKLQRGRLSDDLVFLTRVRARLSAPSPLHDGVNTLVFTLGRGGTDGGWLITAVSTSP